MLNVKELRQHKDNILNNFKHEIINAGSKGLNSRSLLYKAVDREAHCFQRHRTRILFYCGKLNMAIISCRDFC
jgi:hypothetical protein